MSRVRITAPSADSGGSLGPNPNARVEKDGTFTLDGVSTGSHWIRSAGQLNGWTLKSVLASNHDIVDTPIELRSGQALSNVNLIFTNKHQEINGTVTNEQGQPVTDFTVLAFGADPDLWRPLARQIGTARPDQNGKFPDPKPPARQLLRRHGRSGRTGRVVRTGLPRSNSDRRGAHNARRRRYQDPGLQDFDAIRLEHARARSSRNCRSRPFCARRRVRTPRGRLRDGPHFSRRSPRTVGSRWYSFNDGTPSSARSRSSPAWGPAVIATATARFNSTIGEGYDLNQLIVERDDVPPLRVGRRRGGCMTRGDARLKGIRTCRATQVPSPLECLQSPPDEQPIPSARGPARCSRTGWPARIDPRLQARRLDSPSARRGRGPRPPVATARPGSAQPSASSHSDSTHPVVAGRRRVALVEDQVNDLEHRRQPRARARRRAGPRTGRAPRRASASRGRCAARWSAPARETPARFRRSSGRRATAA